MTVYIDNMRASFGRMIMCHMIADTRDELHAMADRIGVNRKWFQSNSSYEHYDISLAKRAMALESGAIEISRRQLAIMLSHYHNTGRLGSLERANKVLMIRRLRKRLNRIRNGKNTLSLPNSYPSQP